MMNKKIAIFGAGDAGQYLCDELLKNGFEVAAFLDNLREGAYRGITIYHPEEFFDISDNDGFYAIFFAAGAQKTLKLMMDTCLAHDFQNLYMMHDIAGKCRLPLFDEKGLIEARVRRIRFSNDKPTLAYFEVPVTDLCNLNCKGCLFASNMPGDNQHVSFDSIQKDARRMAELFFDVPWIRILGGEPLMHPEIIGILECYRELFPDTEIDLCTNGLLIPKMEKKFWDCVKKNRISIHVSGYKPTYNMLDQIDAILRNFDLPYVILKRESFIKYYTNQPDNDMEQSYEKCIASNCYEVYRGKISSCSAVIAFEKFNQQFGTKYQITENEDWFDIHRADADAKRISEALGKASYLCRYCNTQEAESFEWDYAVNGSGLQDYLIERE